MISHALRAWWLETVSYARIVPPLPRRASATPKKNVSCFFDLAGVKFFLKMERTFFFLGFCLPSIQAGGGTMRTKFWQILSPKNSFAKTSADLFLNSDVANGKGGVWGGIFHLLLFLFWRNSGRTKNRKSNSILCFCHSTIFTPYPE